MRLPRRRRGGGGGSVWVWPSVWPFGCIADVSGVGGVLFVDRVLENKKAL